ncbi:hypothetical protein MKW92_013336 [Papaver armeniacum]|nr:hypothetical protein MKW92_013336 [Papaver armeniacum]
MNIPTRITPNELVHLIDQDSRPGAITFTYDDLPTDGRNHNKGLYITVGWENMIIPFVFMDNGAGVGPLKTFATFLVMDIAASFNLLLGRPWMHNNGIGASSLHQKTRFWMGNTNESLYTQMRGTNK